MILGIEPQPSGLGSRLAAGPPGLVSIALLVSILSQLATGTLAAATARSAARRDRRDDKWGMAYPVGVC